MCRYVYTCCEPPTLPTRRSSDLRLSGSSDLYQQDARHPYASINFVTAHDGFTLRDIVSYDGKHNEANDEDNRDGTKDRKSTRLNSRHLVVSYAVFCLKNQILHLH